MALGLALPGAWYYRQWQQERDLESVIAELDNTDPDWRWESYQSKRKVLTDENNSALQVIIVGRASGKRWSGFSERTAGQLEKLPSAVLPDGERLAALRAELARHEKELAEAYKLAQMPEGRHPVAYSPDMMGTLIPTIQESRQVAPLLAFDAMLRIHDGDDAGALRSCQAILNTGRSVGDEPFLVASLVRIVGGVWTFVTVERILAQGEADPAGLKEMQKRLEGELAENILRPAMRGERAFRFEFLSRIHSGEIDSSLARSLIGPPSPRSGVRGMLDGVLPVRLTVDRAEYLRVMNRFIAVLDLPTEQQLDAAEAIAAEVRRTETIPPWLSSGFEKVMAASLRHKTNLGSAVAALAAERYRLKHGYWPRTLEVLVQEGFLKEVPRDPFDGQALRWKRLADGAVVYSVGLDKTDNGGVVDRLRPEVPGFDLGFRLWDVPARRQPPLVKQANE